MFSKMEGAWEIKTVGGILATVVAGIVMIKWIRRHTSSSGKKDYPANTVILHQIGRAPYAPSFVPFVIKLETYLRMAKIPYQNEFSMKKSRKNKYPWITYNGQEIADSTFCMHFLNKKFDLDLNGWMTSEQRAVAVAFQRLVEDDLYWVLTVTRWQNELSPDFMRVAFAMVPFPLQFVKWFVAPGIHKMAYAQGMGRHSPDDVRQIARRDFTALSVYLGEKKFLMGDQPSEVDCAVFGQLAQVYWQLPSSINTIFTEEFPSLVSYCERMKETFWPDWDAYTTEGRKLASKDTGAALK